MTRSRTLALACKWAALLSVFVCLISAVLSLSVRGTTAYMSSLSVTCVNTFSSDEVSDPDKPQEPDNPPTSDADADAFCAAGAVVGGMVLILHRRRGIRASAEH